MYKATIALATALLVAACSDDNGDNGGARPDTRAPTIATLSDITLAADTPSDVIGIVVQDDTTAADQLRVTLTSSDQSVVADAGLALAQNGAARSLVITPVADMLGETLISLSVSDAAGNTAGAEFTVTLITREVAASTLVDDIAQRAADDEPVFINQVSVTGDVDELTGFDALVD